MSDSGASYRSAAASAGSFVATFALAFAAMAALFAIDTFLAERERAASRSEARRLFEEGVRLEHQGAARQAVDRLRAAVSTERDNPVYQRALGAALVAAGQLGDAQAVLTERLERDPIDAEASLLMARTLAHEQKTREAIAYYHRAIYGRWERGDDRANRVLARFELVELLAAEQARRELLAELLPLEAEAPTDAATRKRIGRLFIAAGSPSRAAEIFREVVRRDRDDAAGYAGLGEAELQQGNYRAAQADFATSLKLRPDDQMVAARLDLCARVLALDPTRRGLGAAEQYRRSRGLLDATLAAVDSCAGPRPGATDSALIDTVRSVLRRRVPRLAGAEAVEENLDLAQRVWQLREPACPVSPSSRAVELVLKRLAE